jgi:hypothetical protein
MANIDDLARLLVAIAAGDRPVVRASLDAAPLLATVRLARRDEWRTAPTSAPATAGPPNPCTRR